MDLFKVKTDKLALYQDQARQSAQRLDSFDALLCNNRITAQINTTKLCEALERVLIDLAYLVVSQVDLHETVL